MSALAIGKGSRPFKIPLDDFITSTQAILARKRSGKSYTASVQAEELLRLKQQIGVIDPTGAWWGLRSSADGQGEGYPIVVFGGDHEDAPLDFRSGKAMAAAFVMQGFSAIFDIGRFTTQEQLQFVLDFCAELLRINKNPMHLFMDEADTFAPQKTSSQLQEKCLGTVTRLVSQGGIRGIGFTMITQRSQKISKDVLSNTDLLTVLRMGHPLDVGAAVDWIKSEVSVDFANEVKAALPGIPIGTAFFCSASRGIGERVEVRERRTFNSGATPKPGQRTIEPKILAAIDIAKLGKEIAASVEKVKQESPEFLKKRIAGLEAEVAKGGRVDMGFMEEARAAHEELVRLRVECAAGADLHRHAEELEKRLAAFADAVRQVVDQFSTTPERPVGQVSLRAPVALPIPAPRAIAQPRSDGEGLSGPAERILAALARFYAIRVYSPPRIQVCLFSGYSNLSSTGFVKAVSALRTAGLIDYGEGTYSLTPEGAQRAPEAEPIRNSGELQDAIFGIMGGPERRILELLIREYPGQVSRETAMLTAGYSNLSSTGFVKAMSRLRSLGYIDYLAGGLLVATTQCFLPGRT